ncbi:MAG: hypothetical protein IT176_03475 [Acidobacteria bacterium]|nr:hypothetical protein [Acidobacteriota bacterium]
MILAFAAIAILAAFGVFYVSSELAARRWIRRRRVYYVWPPGLRLRISPDRRVCSTFERTTRFEVNADGERGGALPRHCTGLYRILVAGGSQAEGYLLDQDTAWPGALQRLLSTSGRLAALVASRVHVGSIARSGVGSEALGMIFEKVLPRYPRLSAIVIMAGASDVIRWLEDGTPPRPMPPKVPDLFRCHPEARFGWHPRRSALVELARRARRRWLRPVDVHDHSGRYMLRARDARLRARVLETTPPPEPMIDHFDRCFRHALRLAKAHADRVIIARQPWWNAGGTPEETPHIWSGSIGKAWTGDPLTTFYSVDVLMGLMARMDRRAAAIAEELDVEQIDLMPYLAPTLDNFYDFVHLTPAGASIVAQAIAAVMLKDPGAAPEALCIGEAALPGPAAVRGPR